MLSMVKSMYHAVSCDLCHAKLVGQLIQITNGRADMLQKSAERSVFGGISVKNNAGSIVDYILRRLFKICGIYQAIPVHPEQMCETP